MFYELALTFQDTLHTYQPFSLNEGKLDCTKLSSTLQKEIISLGEKYLTYSFLNLPATSFMSFTRTGNRVDYEELYFDKRRALNALVMAECIESRGRFMDSIIDGIFSICEESAWQLPAHNSYIRDTTQLLLPDSDLPVLDLFACETGALLAVIDFLLGNQLTQISPIISKRIESEIHKRILTPYLTTHFWWMGNGDEPMCNWTIWCTQNILITTFLSHLSSEIRQSIFLKSCRSIDLFLKDYGEDGCCDEGAQYYRHAGLCLFNAMEVLNAVTDNHFHGLYSNEKIRNIASYILNVHVDDEYYINFADCSPIAGRAGAREFLFGKRIKDYQLMKFAALDFQSDTNKLMPMEINLFYRMQSALTQEELLSYDTNTDLIHKDIYYESVGIFKVHDDTTCLAVKAGDNNDSHNHNDTGSFTIYKNRKPLFIDVGVESYSKKTFSKKRYEIWTMQSSFHNLPEIDFTMQKAGEKYKAIDVKPIIEEDIASISMDISPTYPLAGLQYFNRSISLIRNKAIVIKDSWAGCKHVILNLMTYEKPSILSNELFIIGDLAKVMVSGAQTIDVEAIPITDKRLLSTWKHEIYRIQITAKHEDLTLQIH